MTVDCPSICRMYRVISIYRIVRGVLCLPFPNETVLETANLNKFEPMNRANDTNFIRCEILGVWYLGLF